jgi:uncharacterized protein (TIGR02996 family)
MTPDDAFLQAIINDPDDDTPRLVYADYLDDRGENERAEFIRVQCELARLPDAGAGQPSPRRQELEARERQLLGKHEDEWAGCLQGRVDRFHRGFVDAIWAADHEFLEQAAA